MTEERPRRGAGVNSLSGRRHGPLGSSYGLCPPLLSDLPQLDALRVHGHASNHHALVATAARCHTSPAHELDGLLDIASSARPGPYVSLSSTLDVACPLDAVQNVEQAPALASTGADSSSSRDSNGNAVTQRGGDGRDCAAGNVDVPSLHVGSERQAPAVAYDASTPSQASQSIGSNAKSSGVTSDVTVSNEDGDAEECAIVIDVGDAGGVTINTSHVTIKCDNNFSFTPVVSDGQVLPGLLAEVPGNNTHLNVIPVVPRQSLLQRMRGFVKRPTRAQTIQAAKAGAIIAIVPHVCQFLRRAWVGSRAKRALNHGRADVLQRLIASKSTLVRMKVIQVITNDSHRTNAEQLWNDDAFTPIPDHVLMRSVSSTKNMANLPTISSSQMALDSIGLSLPTLPESATLPTLLKPPSVPRLASSTPPPPELDTSVQVSPQAEAVSNCSSATGLLDGMSNQQDADNLLSSVVTELINMLGSRDLRQMCFACTCIQKLAFSGDRLSQKLVTGGALRHSLFSTVQRRTIYPVHWLGCLFNCL